MANVAKVGDTTFPITEEIKRSALMTALRDFEHQYTLLTNAAHKLAEGQANYDISQAADGIKNAYDRINRFSGFGDIPSGDDPDRLDKTMLGPDSRMAGVRKVYTRVGVGSGQTTHVNELNTGLSLYFGLNSWEGTEIDKIHHQPFVSINCEDMDPQFFSDEEGTPILSVSIGDYDAYDNEGGGDKVRGLRMLAADVAKQSGWAIFSDAIVYVTTERASQAEIEQRHTEGQG